MPRGIKRVIRKIEAITINEIKNNDNINLSVPSSLKIEGKILLDSIAQVTREICISKGNNFFEMARDLHSICPWFSIG